jgi:hypothetical protein
VVEQKVGLINPDEALFALEYVRSVRGVSKTTDALVDAQIRQIIDGREALRTDPKLECYLLVSRLCGFNEREKAVKKAQELLSIDILKHTLDVKKINKSLKEL